MKYSGNGLVMSCLLSWKAELSGDNRNDVSCWHVHTPVSCVNATVFDSLEAGAGGEGVIGSGDEPDVEMFDEEAEALAVGGCI
jgi:hypothetical protein